MTRLSFTIAMCCCFLLVHTASSQTKRYVKTVATGSGSGTSWADASSNLQAMIDASATNDEVWIAKGTYHPTTPVGYTAAHVAYTDDRHKSFFVHTGVKLYGAFAGTETLLSQRNFETNKTILSGDLLGNDAGFTNNTENTYHVLVSISSHTMRVDGITITGGNTTGMPATYLNDAPAYTPIPADGAGVYAYDNDFYISTCIFTNNYATGNGGAISNYSFSEADSIENSLFVNNRAAQGSVLYAGGSADSHTTLFSCTMSKNISNGATLYTIYGNNVDIWSCIVWNNTVVGGEANAYAYYSTVLNFINNGENYSQAGTIQSDPLFINPADPDGADNILGTSDDGLIPQCGPAIDAGFAPHPLPATDIRNATRIQDNKCDMGAYETPFVAPITSVTIHSVITIPNTHDPDDDITENDLPTPTGACEGGGLYFTAPQFSTGGIYQWKRNGINDGINSSNYTPTEFHQGDQFRLDFTTPTGSCLASTVLHSNTISLPSVSNGLPVLTPITGPTNACIYANAAPVAYTVRKVPNAVIYYWQFSVTGGGIVSHPNGPGENDTIVLVSFTSAYAGGHYIAVNAKGWCGWSGWKKLSIGATIPSATGTITGPIDVCPFMQSAINPTGTPVTYSVRKVVGAAAYIWTVPTGATINSHAGTGDNDTAITVTYSSSFVSGTVTAQATNGCGARAAKALAISKKASGTPGTITGPADACPLLQSATNPTGTEATYTIRKVLYATSYTWSLPADATATHPGGTGSNDTIIKLIYSSSFVSGSITVVSNTNCSSSAVRSLAITRKFSGTPGTITGPTSVCAFMQSPSNPSGTPVDYTIKKVLYAFSYTWTLPAGASATHPGGTGINDTILRVVFANSFAGGVITVKSNTNCSTSSAKSLSIIYKLPYTPGTITASVATTCPQRRITYSIAALPSYATSVLWTVPASGIIISGQNTLSLVVEFAGPTALTDTVRVISVNDCGTSVQRKVRVAALAGTCRAGNTEGKNNEESIPVTVTKIKTPVLNAKEEFDVTAMPNPSHQHFTLRLSGADINMPISLRVIDATGRVIETNQNIQSNQMIVIGDSYQPGVYFATFIKGEKKKIVRLVKL